MKKSCVVLLFLLSAIGLQAQVYGLAPDFLQRFTDNNGQPLSGGLLYTCTAGSSCPGNPLSSFVDATGVVANTNPVVLSASGTASIWLQCSLSYKLVLATSTNVVIKTTDNIGCTGTGSGGGLGGTQYWSLSGSTISNTNGAGAGNVSIGGALAVTSPATFQAGIKLRDTQPSPHYAILMAGTIMPTDVTWRWPVADAVGCLTSNGTGTLSFSTSCGGGGGGGTPGGSDTNIQFNNMGTFGGSPNLIWEDGAMAKRLTIVGSSSSVQGLVILNTYAQADVGFAAVNNLAPSTPLTYVALQAPTGGVYANSIRAISYSQIGTSSGAPSVTTGDTFQPGAEYWDTGTASAKIYNGSAWVTLATGGATAPGGATTNIQFNNGGAFAGSANLTFDNTAGVQRMTIVGSSSSVQGLVVLNTYVQADVGFAAVNNSNPSAALTYVAFQAPTGGAYVKSLRAISYTQTGNSAGIPSLTSGDTLTAGAMYWDTVIGAERIYNGSTWASLGSGGGTGSPGGINTSVQFNNSGAFGGSTGLIWDDTNKRLTVVGSSSLVQGIVVANTYVQADVGFAAINNGAPSTPLTYVAVQAPTGGVYARSLRAISYTQTGTSTGPPTLTTGDTLNAGAMYWDTSGNERVYNGSVWVNLATGGLSSLNGLTGGVSIAGTANEITVAAGGSTVTLATPQPIATSSTPTFAGVIATGNPFNSTATGTSSAFQTNAGTFIVNGQGDIASATFANTNGYKINGTTVIDASRNGTFATLVTTGTGATIDLSINGNASINGNGVISAVSLNIAAGAGQGVNVTGNTAVNTIQTTGGMNVGSTGNTNGVYQINGSTVIDNNRFHIGPINTGTGGFSSLIWTGPTGNFYNRAIGASAGLSCSGILDGWTAVSSDDFLVVCLGGARFRAALSAF